MQSSKISNLHSDSEFSGNYFNVWKWKWTITGWFVCVTLPALASGHICQHDLCAWPRSVCLRAVEEKRLTATFIFGPRDGMQSETVKFVWCFFCWTSDKCLTRSLVVVKVYSLPVCTFRTLAVRLREQLWLVKLTENHNSILVRVMLQCCGECCIDCSLKKEEWSQLEYL